MKEFTLEQLDKILEEKLSSDYPGDCVELGENWEIIAQIFYKVGFDEALKENN